MVIDFGFIEVSLLWKGLYFLIIFLFIEETVFILVVNNKKIFPSNRFETQIKLNTILTLVTKHLLITNKNNLKAYISRSFRET